MLSDFIIGSSVGILVMLVHLLATLCVYLFVHLLGKKLDENRVIFLIISLVSLYVILFICLCISVTIWATAYYHMGLVDNYGDAFYSAILNYTTLGTGDLNQMAKTRLIGPITGASGILMFSWAAALLVYIIQLHLPVMLKKRWEK
ncbi:ion channel [Brucella gallinifaecis]|uniref:ion channel n=1 Tax=Brucella gallinifaecis TaxID=215590 RepID=UPI00235F339C|nr:ion channel [Brucella gallinifaecis]